MISVVVGRHPNCDIVVNDPTVSRQHATIVEVEQGHYIVKDEASSCGTFVLQPIGWDRISTARVAASDRLRLGAFETTIETLLGGVKTAKKPAQTVERNPRTGEIIVRAQ